MKTFFATLVAFSLALIIGCQENLINEPAATLSKKYDSMTSNTLKICCEVRDPEYGICNLSGCVNYVHQIINRPINPTGLYTISLKLNMDSKLCDKLGMVHLEWRAEGRSNDIVSVSEEGILLVEKSYWITNRTDVVLLVQYLVTTDGIGISGVSLAPLEK